MNGLDVKIVSGKLKRITIEALSADFINCYLVMKNNSMSLKHLFLRSGENEFYVVRSQKYLIEVLTKGVNKAFGLEKL